MDDGDEGGGRGNRVPLIETVPPRRTAPVVGMGARYLWFEQIPIARFVAVRPLTRLVTILIARWICRRRGEKQFGVPWSAIVITSALAVALYTGVSIFAYVLNSLITTPG
jgi:hypothetical protein